MRLAWLALVLLLGCEDSAVTTDAGPPGADGTPDATSDGTPDATPDGTPDADLCDVDDCHVDCFGGSICIQGVAWAYAYEPRDCCHTGPQPECGATSYSCTTSTCATPDPRYAVCLDNLNRSTYDPIDSDEHLRLHCEVEGASKHAGDACVSDLDCRPAAEGEARLSCVEGKCAGEERPAAPAGYGASCGIPADDLAALLGERGISTTAAICDVCQVARAEGGCLRQACSMACTYDEDCPAGSICLCGEPGAVAAYCAAATDRDTPEGRAAGLPACEP